jgi:hypothetical protein
MPQSMPLLRPGQQNQRHEVPARAVDPADDLDRAPALTIVEQLRPATPEVGVPPAVTTPGPVEATFLARLLTGWSVGSEVIDEVESLTGALMQRAADQGHGLISMSVSFADRRLRVAVVEDPGSEDPAGRGFELSRGPAGAGAQPEPAVRLDVSR